MWALSGYSIYIHTCDYGNNNKLVSYVLGVNPQCFGSGRRPPHARRPSEMDPNAPPMASNTAMSRLEARLALEGAAEARYPRLVLRKPVLAGMPLGESW